MTQSIELICINKGVNPSFFPNYKKETGKVGLDKGRFTTEFIEWYLPKCSLEDLAILKENAQKTNYYTETQQKLINDYTKNEVQEFKEDKKEAVTEDEQMENTIALEKEATQILNSETEKEKQTIKAYIEALGKERAKIDELYKKIALLQEERDSYKTKAEELESFKIQKPVYNEVKFLYALIDAKMMLKADLADLWRKYTKNDGELLLLLQNWEKEYILTVQEDEQLTKIEELIK